MKNRIMPATIRQFPIVTICVMILLTRIAYDIKTYIYGSSIVFYAEQTMEYDYLLHLPPGYHDFGEPRPLLIYLHGVGEVNQDVRILEQLAPYHFTHGISGINFPFITVCPMSRIRPWNPLNVEKFVENVVNDHRFRYRIDPDRVYLTGFSMGVGGALSTAIHAPKLFAAIVPLAGYGDERQASQLVNVPMWAFHGDRDDVVSIDKSLKIVDAIHAAGSRNARMTVLHGANHGIQELVYTKTSLYKWLLSQNRRLPINVKDENIYSYQK